VDKRASPTATTSQQKSKLVEKPVASSSQQGFLLPLHDFIDLGSTDHLSVATNTLSSIE